MVEFYFYGRPERREIRGDVPHGEGEQPHAPCDAAQCFPRRHHPAHHLGYCARCSNLAFLHVSLPRHAEHNGSVRTSTGRGHLGATPTRELPGFIARTSIKRAVLAAK